MLPIIVMGSFSLRGRNVYGGKGMWEERRVVRWRGEGQMGGGK